MAQIIRFAFLIEPPFCFRTPDGSVTGYDVEMARRALASLGYAMEPIETQFDQLLPGLARGMWDMTTGLFVTDARKRVAHFSRPIWMLPDGLLVRAADAGTISGYGSVAAGSQRILAAVRDQVQHLSALEAGIPDDRILVFGTYEEAAEAVSSHHVDAFASVAMAHRGYLAARRQSGLAVVDVPACEKQAERGAFAFGPGSHALRHQVDSVLENYLGSPEHVALMTDFGFSRADAVEIRSIR
jgi:polar amino acid transport system substrate-binding protein